MSDAVQALQAAAVAAILAHPVLNAQISGVYDGPPPNAAFPYVAVTDGLTSDWSTKTEAGREIRLALTVWDDGESATRLARLMGHVEDAVMAMPSDLDGWRIRASLSCDRWSCAMPQGHGRDWSNTACACWRSDAPTQFSPPDAADNLERK